jgi:hypothetical protein
MVVRQLLAAYRVIKENERKQRQYDALVGTEVNYTIIKDLIASAQHDVVISLTFRDGSKMDIRREDPFDKLRAKGDPEGRY